MLRAREIHVGDRFFFQAEDGIRDVAVTGVQTCALPISYIKSLLLRNCPSLGGEVGYEQHAANTILRTASRSLFDLGWRPHPLLAADHRSRSEEHTSELQSRLHLVCRLLLEKKKQHTNNITHI